MNIDENEILTIFRVRKTTLQMLRDRGYVVFDSKDDLELSRQMFEEKFVKINQIIRENNYEQLRATFDNSTPSGVVNTPTQLTVASSSHQHGGHRVDLTCPLRRSSTTDFIRSSTNISTYMTSTRNILTHRLPHLLLRQTTQAQTTRTTTTHYA